MYKIKLSRKEKKELALSKWFLVGLAIIGIFFVIWLAWIRPAQREAKINSFEACQAAGNVIQESYPEVCLTKDGRRFVNPVQAKSHDEQKDNANQLVPPTDSSKLYLSIDEWDVRVPLTTETFDLIYTYIDDGGPVRNTFTFRRLLQADFCTSDAGVSLTRSLSESVPAPVAKVGDYYYYVAYAGSPCYDPENAQHVALVKQIAGEQSLTQAIGKLLEKLEAEPAE